MSTAASGPRSSRAWRRRSERGRDYSTWFDCCGFGFRHILVQRDFTRSFATQRKIERMKEEANPDVTLTHDTGCVTTLDKSQFAAKAHDRNVGVPVMSEAQFAALAMGAHPYKVCQLHWHSADYRPLLEKMGIDWEAAWASSRRTSSGSSAARSSS
jgi:heterodisulfide reductase subunit B